MLVSGLLSGEPAGVSDVEVSLLLALGGTGRLLVLSRFPRSSQASRCYRQGCLLCAGRCGI